MSSDDAILQEQDFSQPLKGQEIRQERAKTIYHNQATRHKRRCQETPTHGSQQYSLELAAFNHQGGETLREPFSKVTDPEVGRQTERE